MSIKVIFFDLGKVLVDFDWRKTVDAMAGQSVLPPDQIAGWLTENRWAIDFERGKVTSDEFFSVLKSETGFRGSANRLRTIFSDIFEPIASCVKLAEKFSIRYPLGIISNTNEAHIDWIEKRFDFFRIFRTKIFSFQTGFLKPEKKIFECALDAAGVHPDEALFIDDLAVNVKGATSSGWNAIHLTPSTDLEAELLNYTRP